MKVLLANPRGFCAGVDRAIEIVERALERLEPPIYVRHEVVHNRPVVEQLKAKGAIFLDDLSEVPEGATVIFSAHGVSQAVRKLAKEKNFQLFDATCPLVTKVHMEVVRFARKNIECVLIGHAGHPEVEGTMGQYHNDSAGIYLVETVDDVKKLQLKNPHHCAYVTQTTLSIDDTALVLTALKEKFPAIECPKNEDICYATTNRQNAVKILAAECDVMIVVGSKESSNSNRLKELAERLGCQSYLLDDPDVMQKTWFTLASVVGVTAGASAPENLVQKVITRLRDWGAEIVEETPGVEENIIFALPKALRVEAA
ncbi:MAG: 4-hydroxy-3-methylbut-2-enyl diphosphate reductase [Gammaproteobacteria bacterium RIFCSPLOWO2_02_FULL_42_14]|nr:MAG: 4-hydroxy-3-methylbut-2-enyl diphosphate reductase [Gammaproteobacteria bacterium RIFCSPHIGHO2_02_FULL_42_43]OGT51993.1 MAG: 4-hydroxy-3-methylbut-2-enyl diphosphate reductase [Gammaproteobacteria bacterium RIFCSPHIGHO2_12_FULL_41_25]OGT61098.1 MAG: 4-hydroxy-3-methylbut-2-enyl diphosphate reductase [Gammaproteobacteria bacterium RIFCSPLOWO2_02_FULL_42_14]OGT87026.1 MAG: 4-hydroxy-3-methylbut-2-enyl diphosphate reductase [Gammaproteobacteria bacterium RIFCSPLOWO2_12_FULL_42_18]